MQIIGKLKTYRSDELKKTRIGIGFECVDRDLIKPEKCYDLFAETGAKFARCQTGWAKTERVKGIYDFAWLDDIVDNLIARGVTPWFNVGYGNPLYMNDVSNPTAVGCVPLFYGEECTAAWMSFLKATAEHFKGRITHWEIWNEPDIIHFWYPNKPDPKAYAELVNVSARAIKEVIPDAKIGACTSGSKIPYMFTLFKNIPAGELDFYSFHSYDRIPEESWISEKYSKARKLLDAFGHKNCEIWMGEGGHASWHPVGHSQCKAGGGNERRQAIWYLRRGMLDLAAEVKLTSFYIIADVYERPYETAAMTEKKPAAHGILNGLTYTPKKVHSTLKNLCAVLSGDLVGGDGVFHVDFPFETFCKRPKTVSFLRNGKEIFAYWNPVPVEEDSGVRQGASADIPLSSIENPVVIDLLEGTVSLIDPEDFVKETGHIENLPIADYPMLICDKDTFECV